MRHHSIVAAAVFSLTACSGAGQTADLTVNWSIRNVDGSEVGCDPSYSSIMVHVLTYSDMPGVYDHESTKLFDCSAGTGTWTLPIDGPVREGADNDLNGHYDVWISQTDPTGEVARQVSLPEYFVDLTAGDRTVDLTLYEDGGYLAIAWNFSAASDSSRDLDTCAQAGVDRIEITAVGTETGATSTVTFPCDHQRGHEVNTPGTTFWSNVGGGVTPVLAAGEYDVTVRAFMGSVMVGASEPTFSERVLDMSQIDEGYSAYNVIITTR
jgi:hypothetical protein